MSIRAYAEYDGKEVPVVGFDMGRVVLLVNGEYIFAHNETVTHSRFPDEAKPAELKGHRRVRVSDQP